jgi:cadmium resistance protein CadD (predicted permease)
MNAFVEIAVVAGASFISTSTDNLVLLAVLLAKRGQRALPVMLGYVAAAAVIGAAGLVVARLADVFPPNLIGYLGVVPLGMGIVRLVRAVRGPGREQSATMEARTIGSTGVATLMLANSSDTFSVLAPLFAETPEPYTYVMVATIIVVSIGWFGLALAVGGHPRMRGWIARADRWVVPLLLIGIGLYVLADTATDTLP